MKHWMRLSQSKKLISSLEIDAERNYDKFSWHWIFYNEMQWYFYYTGEGQAIRSQEEAYTYATEKNYEYYSPIIFLPRQVLIKFVKINHTIS